MASYHVFKDVESAGKAVATVFCTQILKKPDCVLGLATGSTPVPAYRYMTELYRQGVVDFTGVTSFNLDEYCGLGHSHEQSYHYFMMEHLFKHINIPQERIHVPNGLASDPDAECMAYEEMIAAAGGIDLQLLGLGQNGHIGFNEPCSSFPEYTHKVELTESTVEANKRFFNSASEVPRSALTMGIGTIMKSRAIVLIATGIAKAEAVRAALMDDPSPMCPASVLRFHPNVMFFLDQDAASACNIPKKHN